MKINVKISKGKQFKEFSVDIAKLCLELCGGGLSTQQTSKAIELHQKFNDTGKIKVNGFTIEKV